MSCLTPDRYAWNYRLVCGPRGVTPTRGDNSHWLQLLQFYTFNIRFLLITFLLENKTEFRNVKSIIPGFPTLHHVVLIFDWASKKKASIHMPYFINIKYVKQK